MEMNAWRVLVVEDEYDSVQMVSKILRHNGIETEVVHNGEECMVFLEANRLPSLVVMDLSMPHMDGWQTLAAIRSNPDTAHLPVIAMTAYDSALVAEDAYRAGFQHFFAKPIHPLEFIEVVTEILQNN